MVSETSHNIAKAMMVMFLLASVFTVLFVLNAKEECIIWDYGTSSYSYDDECLSYETDLRTATKWAVVASASFSFSVLLFLYSMSSALQESSKKQEE